MNKFIAEERLASWKVLLPLKKNTKLFILGGEEWLAKNLNRSVENIDWHNPNNRGVKYDLITNDYDIIVIANQLIMEQYLKELTNITLQKDVVTVLVNFTSPISQYKKNICDKSKYNFFLSFLPISSPRLFLPVTSSRFLLDSLSFHQPGSKKARYALSLLKILVRFGFTKILQRKGILFWSDQKIVSREGALQSWLSRKMSRQVDNITIYCGSDLPRRKITLLIESFGDNGRTLHVAKVADTFEGKKAILQESNTLKLLPNLGKICWYPEFCLEDEWEGHWVQLQTAFAPSLKMAGPKLTSDHYNVLDAFTRFNRKNLRLSETAEWITIHNRLKNYSQNLPDSIRSLWHFVNNSKYYNYNIPVHFIHGDFTSWNIRKKGDKLAIFDWEDSRIDGLPFYDLFRFMYRQSALVGPWPGSEKMLIAIEESMDQLRHQAGFATDLKSYILPILILDEYMNKPNRYLDEVAALFLMKQK